MTQTRKRFRMLSFSARRARSEGVCACTSIYPRGVRSVVKSVPGVYKSDQLQVSAGGQWVSKENEVCGYSPPVLQVEGERTPW